MERQFVIACWLFLIGSSLLIIDAIFKLASEISLMSLINLVEGILFLVGSILFMPDLQTDA
ncbi:MAG: hypothetical protein F6J95_027410 [Leptolyngbya sp. SIO1E4]|nr:hypothetical protein [Leptolyngbya sp. SIO1E4]